MKNYIYLCIMKEFQEAMEKAHKTTSLVSRMKVYQEIYELIEDRIYTAIRNERERK